MFSDRDPFVITTATGEELARWNAAGKDIDYTEVKGKILHNIARLGFMLAGDVAAKRKLATDIVMALTSLDLTKDENLERILRKLETLKSMESAHAVWAEYEAKSKPAPAPVVPAPQQVVPPAPEPLAEIVYEDATIGGEQENIL